VATAWGIRITPDASYASITLGVHADSNDASSRWVYALVAPFPTVMDGITSKQLEAVWKGSSTEAFGKWPLLLTATTLAALTDAWGASKASL
jgi:hypothetical protein